MPNVNIPREADQWTAPIDNEAFRIWPHRRVESIWRKTTGEHCIGGYIVHVAPLDSAVAREWLEKIEKA